MNPNQQVGKRSDLKDLLERPGYKTRLQQVLGERAPQFAAALIQVVSKSYQLSQCTPESVIGSAMTAAALDLSIDPNLGEAHLVPYADKCQLQIGYIGLSQLAMRSGQYRHMGWDTIYEGELKEWNRLTGKLVINKDGKKPGAEIVGYAAMFELLNGFERASYWTKEQIEEHAQRYSQAYKRKKMDSPWYTNFDRMALKTVLKDLIKTWGPKSITMQRAVVEDNTVRTDINAEPEYPEATDVDSTVEPHKPEPTGYQQATKTPAQSQAVHKQDKGEDNVPMEGGTPLAEKPPKMPQDVPAAITTPSGQETSATAPATQQQPGESETEALPEQPPETAQEAGPATNREPDPELADKANDNDAMKNIKYLARESGVTSRQITLFCQSKKLARADQSWMDLSASKLISLGKAWAGNVAEIAKL